MHVKHSWAWHRCCPPFSQGMAQTWKTNFAYFGMQKNAIFFFSTYKKYRLDAQCFHSSPIPSIFSSSYLPSHSEAVPSVTFFFILGGFQYEVLIGYQAELPECSSEAKPIGLCQSYRRYHIVSIMAAGKRLLNHLGCIHKARKTVRLTKSRCT